MRSPDKLLEQGLTLITLLSLALFNFQEEAGIGGISGNRLSNLCLLALVLWWGLKLWRRGYMLWSPLLSFGLAFVLLSFLSYLYSYAPEDSFYKIKTLAIIFALALSLCQFAETEARTDRLLSYFALIAPVTALYLLMKSDVGSARWGAVIGDANLVGNTMSLSVLINVYLFGSAKKWHYLFFALFSTMLILLTGSRTAVLVLLPSLALYGRWEVRKRGWRWWQSLLALALGGLCLWALYEAVFHIPLLYDMIGIRFESLLQIIGGQESVNNESSAYERWELIQRALAWFAESPLLGHGIGSVPSYNAGFSEMLKRFSHCNYTEILASLGVLGFAAYYGMQGYVGICLLACAACRRSKYYPVLSMLWLAFFFRDFGLVFYYDKLTWAVFGLMAAMLRQCSEAKPPETGTGKQCLGNSVRETVPGNSVDEQCKENTGQQ